jgi:hypothetical protein
VQALHCPTIRASACLAKFVSLVRSNGCINGSESSDVKIFVVLLVQDLTAGRQPMHS